MDELKPSDLKTILHSKRANLYYLQHCRVLVKDGRVEYVTDQGSQSAYWNIPIANTTTILLGTGTSITQSAMREFAKAGVLVGFSGTGGSPLYAGTERDIDIAWLTPQSEYRPTQYLQQWVSFWFDDDLRVQAAKHLQHQRLRQIAKHWPKILSAQNVEDCDFNIDELKQILQSTEQRITQLDNVTDLLSLEAGMTKQLYKLAVKAVGYNDFTRAKRGSGTDLANSYLDHGNYLAYGLAACACWVLGLPHGLAVMHGKTRRGGLVFDAADIIKDALVLPNAFISAMLGEDQQEFRQRCLNTFRQADAMDIMIDTLQYTADSCATEAQKLKNQ